VLLVEDSENDALLIEREISRGGYDVELTRVTTAEEMRGQLESCDWDLVISDYHLPGSSLAETLATCRADGRDIPFLLVSGTVGDEAAVAAMKGGVHDYVHKDSLTRLVPVIERELEEARLRKTARDAQDRLAESRSLLEAAQEIGDIGTFVAWRTPEKRGQDEWSKACMRIYGCDERTFDGTQASFWLRVHPDDLENVKAAQAEADLAGRTYDMRHRIVRPDGEVRWVHERARVERDAAGTPIRYIGVTRDVTEEKVAEDSLRASEARNAAVVEAAVDSLIVADAESLITGFNPAAERLFGYRRAEVLGRDVHSLIVPERFQDAHRAALRRNLEDGDVRYLDRRLEVILRRSDGTEFPAEATTTTPLNQSFSTMASSALWL